MDRFIIGLPLSWHVSSGIASQILFEIQRLHPLDRRLVIANPGQGFRRLLRIEKVMDWIHSRPTG